MKLWINTINALKWQHRLKKPVSCTLSGMHRNWTNRCMTQTFWGAPEWSEPWSYDHGSRSRHFSKTS